MKREWLLTVRDAQGAELERRLIVSTARNARRSVDRITLNAMRRNPSWNSVHVQPAGGAE
jgi:hypothetical protein